MRAGRDAERVLDRDPAGRDVVVERLVEGLHAVVGALGDDDAEATGL